MILDKGHSKQYLEDWQNGKIRKGLGIGCPVTDQYLRYKQGQLNMILGLDNVGKTHAQLWYQLVLSVHHGITWDVWSGENNPSQSMKKLIEMLANERIDKMAKHKLYNYHDQIEMWFNFIDIKKMYDIKQIFDIFGQTESKGCLIDPYTGLKREYGHSDNYKFLNDAREFTNFTGKTMYVTSHPRTEAGVRQYIKGHDLEGYIKPPLKAHSEGGQAFANRVDDFIIYHRMTDHPHYRTKTELHVKKVKDTDTGGGITISDEPVFLDYNNGLGFTINGFNPLLNKPQAKQIELKPNKAFDINHTIEPKPTKDEDWLNGYMEEEEFKL